MKSLAQAIIEKAENDLRRFAKELSSGGEPLEVAILNDMGMMMFIAHYQTDIKRLAEKRGLVFTPVSEIIGIDIEIIVGSPTHDIDRGDATLH